MFIDSSNIRNKLGNKDSIGFCCPQDKKHKGNKVSVICNDNGKIVNCTIDKCNVHDLKLFDKTVKGIKYKMIVGDKGYTNNNKKLELKKKGIKILYLYKKNSKIKIIQMMKKIKK